VDGGGIGCDTRARGRYACDLRDEKCAGIVICVGQARPHQGNGRAVVSVGGAESVSGEHAPPLRLTQRPELAALKERLHKLQAGWCKTEKRCATGLKALDEALGGGFALGSVHEVLAPAFGVAARSLALRAAARLLAHTPPPGGAGGGKSAADGYGSVRYAATGGCRCCVSRGATAAGRGPGDQESAAVDPDGHKWLLYIDTGGDFYPPAAAQLGLSLERIFLVRRPRRTDALWVCEQALRCPAIAAVVLSIHSVDSYVSRRLQLAAEIGGGLGFLLRSEGGSGQTFATTRLRLDPLPGARSAACRLRVTVLKMRGGGAAEPFELALPLGAERAKRDLDAERLAPAEKAG